MKIVIDIPEEVFDEIYNKNCYSLIGKNEKTYKMMYHCDYLEWAYCDGNCKGCSVGIAGSILRSGTTQESEGKE